MSNNVKISVVIPAYNRKETIIRCLQSVLGQTVLPYEVIVVDDGSVDGTIEAIEMLNCDLIRIFVQNHQGAQAARNRGIVEARGNYITFLDSDDDFLPECIETQLEYIKKYPYEILYSDCIVLDERRNTRKYWSRDIGTGNVYREILGGNNCPMFQSLLCKKEYLLEIGLLDENVPAYQEWETTIRLAKLANFRHIEKPLFLYRWKTTDSISKDLTRGIKGFSYIIEKHEDEILSVYGKNELIRKYRALLDLCLQNNGYEFLQYYYKWKKLIEEKISDCSDNDVVQMLSLDLYKKNINNQQLAQVFYEWIKKKQNGKGLVEYFTKKKINCIAIYGMNYVGETLLDELIGSNIRVKYGIDRNAENIKSKIKVITPNEMNNDEEVEAIIVTAITYYKEIYDEYYEKWNIPIISLKEVVGSDF